MGWHAPPPPPTYSHDENGPQRAQVIRPKCHEFKVADRDTHNSLSLGKARLAARGTGEGALGSVLPKKRGVFTHSLWENLTKPQECRGAEAKRSRLGTIASVARPPQSGSFEPDLLAPLF